MKNNLIAVGLIALLIGVGGGFFGGMKYQQSKVPSFNRQFTGGPGGLNMAGRGQAGAGNRQGFRPVNGTVLSSDAKSVTVKMTDGSSRIALITESTAINQAASASATDIKVGDRVVVLGTDNPDGSVTAQNIQLNSNMRVPNQ